MFTPLVACVDKGGPPLNGEPSVDPPAEETWTTACMDEDGDGFGIGCGNGADCNDDDPNVTAECYGCTRNATGCACGTDGARVLCGELRTSASGGSSCFMGEKVCSGGVWSACKESTGETPPMKTMGLGSAVSCDDNPCDPYCQNFPDLPDVTMTDIDAGIIATDAGLQLALTEVDPGPPEECASETVEVEPVQLDIYVMLDESGSMLWCPDSWDSTWNGCDGGAMIRWDGVKSALIDFVNSPVGNGVYIALDYFSGTDCTVSHYASPSVNWTLLPGGAGAVQTSLNGRSPGGGTPTRPALEGAIDAAYARATAPGNEDHKVVVVLATDGDPNNCTSTITTVSNAAAAGLALTPSIETYVIGVGMVNNLNFIAAAGGTGSAYISDAGSSASFLAAMEDIRARALGCEYNVPIPSDGNVSPEDSIVNYRLGANGTPTDLGDPVANEAACSGHGYYYEFTNGIPTKMHLCPTTCNLVSSNMDYKVDLTFLCSASCGSSSSEVDPVPLDMYVMLDKSGSMDWCPDAYDNPPCNNGALQRWDAVTGALDTFVDSPEAAGVTMALEYFPSGGDECLVSNYASPSVDWTLLPGGASAIQTSLSNTGPGGGTPTRPALQGALESARIRATAFPNNKVIALLATDGEPNNCSSSITSVAEIATAGRLGTPFPGTSMSVITGNEAMDNISGTGTQSVSGDDSLSGPLNIGFSFPYFGNSFTSFKVSTNGFITFRTDHSDSYYTNGYLPDTSNPDGVVAALWDDLVVDGRVYYQTLGTAPNRRLVVQWTGTRFYSNSATLNFEIVLHESGDISLRYETMSGTHANGDSATIGVEDYYGNEGHQYSRNSGVLSSNMSIRYSWATGAGGPPIPTYVIGVGSVAGLDSIAAAGGSQQAFIVSGGDPDEFIAAVNAIRAQALGCEYNIPPNSLGLVDPSTVTVRYTPGDGSTPSDVPHVLPGQCNGGPGYYLDNELLPTKLWLCDASCNLIGSDMNAGLAIFYDCEGNYNNGTFARDYDATGKCPPSAIHVWSIWDWEAETPGATHVDFTVAVADTLAGLDTAAEVPLLFSSPEGPASLVGAPAVAQAGTPDTQSGSANVDQTLALAGLPRKAPFLRVRSYLKGAPPTYLETPLLKHWNLALSCEYSE